MSSLIFFTDADQAAIATDTLAVDTDNNPMLFSSKALMMPHLRTVIAGTGAGGFSDRWFLQANTRMAVRDVVGLSVHAPAQLRALWKRYHEEYTPPETQTTTVYHFGFEADDGPMRAFAFRSTNNFEMELLPYATGIKPPVVLDDDTIEWPQRFRSIMDKQREVESQRPWAERIQIGGEVHVIHLTRGGFTAFVQSSFEDFPANLESVLKRYST